MGKKFAISLILFFCFIKPISASTNYGSNSYGNQAYGGNTPTPTPAVESNTCTDADPGEAAPVIYSAATQGKESIKIWFSPGGEPVTKYALLYGEDKTTFSYGILDLGLNSREAMNFLIEKLESGKEYFFQLRSDNGCKTGPLSNTISAKTFGVDSGDYLLITDTSIKTKKKEVGAELTEGSNKQDKKYFSIRVLDKNGNPVAGAKIVLYSEPKVAYTDTDGVAVFENVESGDHRVVISYDDYEVEQSLYISPEDKTLEGGDSEEYMVDVTIEKVVKEESVTEAMVDSLRKVSNTSQLTVIISLLAVLIIISARFWLGRRAK